MVVIYEVDLGLNHVVRKMAEKVPSTAHLLIPVPEIKGVLVACENFIIYKKHGHEEKRCLIPLRLDQSLEQGLFIANTATFYNVDMGVIIFLQSEHGDLYKVSLETSGQEVLELSVSYFDTIPPCS